MGVCVPNFRSVSFFVWPGGVTQIKNSYTNTYIQVKIVISATSCSPHVDFDKILKLKKYFLRNFNILPNLCIISTGTDAKRILDMIGDRCIPKCLTSGNLLTIFMGYINYTGQQN